MMKHKPEPDPYYAICDLQDQVELLMGKLHTVELENAALRRLLVQAPPREWLTAAEAAELCGRTPQAVSRWCRLHPIATQPDGGGAWQINRALLISFLIDRFGVDRLPAGLRAP